MFFVSELNLKQGLVFLLLIKQIEENGFLSPAGIPVLSPAMSLQPEVHYSLEVDGIVGLR